MCESSVAHSLRHAMCPTCKHGRLQASGDIKQVQSWVFCFKFTTVLYIVLLHGTADEGIFFSFQNVPRRFFHDTFFAVVLSQVCINIEYIRSSRVTEYTSLLLQRPTYNCIVLWELLEPHFIHDVDTRYIFLVLHLLVFSTPVDRVVTHIHVNEVSGLTRFQRFCI